MKLNIEKGSDVSFNNEGFKIVEILSLCQVLAERVSDGRRMRLPIHGLEEYSESNENNVPAPYELISEKNWKEAERRFSIIEPILPLSNRSAKIESLAEEQKIHKATIYRWIQRFEDSGNLSSLAPVKRTGGQGKSRLTFNVEEIMQSLIESNYLNSQKLNISRLYVDLQLACRDMSIQTPHINTLRKRIQERSESELIRRRHGRKAEEDLNRPIRGKYEKAKFPLSIVQIDHTLLDIFLVDEDTRRPIGRPWITVAIDVYSRMITGFYISFDPPSASTVGLCLSNSILPKEDFMLKNNIEGEWPCWGVMKVVHADNAKEFKGNMLRKACQEYGIDIQWRPVTTPHWGGHIERLIGSLNTEIHSLPGTTFSKTSDRKNYNSEKKASFSLSEFEQYLTTFILGVYHERKHSSLGLSPIYKYKEGLLGSANFSGYGLPAKIRNEDKLRKDFMPFFERSIQNYGVKIDNITYYHDVLRRWINAKESGSSSVKRKFLFRRDPRDISIIYFLDPEEERYYPIPYLNISHPSISIWEYRDALKKLTEDGLNSVDEDKIFDTYKSLTKIKENSTKTTLVNKRKRHTKNGRLNVHQTTPEGSVFKDNDMDFSAIKPFEDIDHDAYKK